MPKVVQIFIAAIFSLALLSPAAVAFADDDRYRELELLTDILSLIEKKYVEEVDPGELLRGAVNGMLATLDPHSSFLPPEMFHELQIDTKGQFGGLGIEISLKDGILTIIAPIEDTPADRAGLQPGDQIVKIEGTLTKGLGLMGAVKLMRGEPGTDVTISVMREDFTAPREFTLTREVIKVRSVKAKTLEDGFGYVRLSQFQEATATELERALETLREENGNQLEGLILDLRNNPGGLLDQAVAVADIFLPGGLIVYTEGRDEENRMQFSAHQQGTEPDYPVVVLINGGSASASEIVAGALRDHRRALLLGTRSFGKGSVQTIMTLSDNAGLRLTTARYYTPNGISIQARGIAPDIEVRTARVKSIEDAEFVHEQNLRNHMVAPERGQAPTENQAEPLEFTPDEEDRKDYQLMRALDLLKGWSIMSSVQPDA